jgi:hypothetical protein
MPIKRACGPDSGECCDGTDAGLLHGLREPAFCICRGVRNWDREPGGVRLRYRVKRRAGAGTWQASRTRSSIRTIALRQAGVGVRPPLSRARLRLRPEAVARPAAAGTTASPLDRLFGDVTASEPPPARAVTSSAIPPRQSSSRKTPYGRLGRSRVFAAPGRAFARRLVLHPAGQTSGDAPWWRLVISVTDRVTPLVRMT